MSDKPILFSGPMVRALLAGTKTQTRRVLRRARVFATPEERALQNASRFRRLDGDGWFWEADAFEWQRPAERTGWMAHIGYAPGDRLYVREAWRTELRNDHIKPSLLGQSLPIYFEAGGGGEEAIPACAGRLRPGMHMPRWASRLTLTVTEVRVQRLQEISAGDAIAEGVEFETADPPFYYVPGLPAAVTAVGVEEPGGNHAQRAYGKLMDHLHGNGFWSTNPWVVATSFTVERRNIDQDSTP